MSGPELRLSVSIFGSAAGDPVTHDPDDRPVPRILKLEMRPRMPHAGMSTPEFSQWAQSMLLRITPDLKHTQYWHCEFCDKPAKETIYNVAAWLNPVPLMKVLSHNMCDASVTGGSCTKAMAKLDKELAAEVGFPRSFKPTRSGLDIPLSGSCAKCNKPNDIDHMKKCGACQLTRYCSAACQRSDWPRHKEFCKISKETEWIWGQSTPSATSSAASSTTQSDPKPGNASFPPHPADLGDVD
ncbi:hypothetical protein FA95DRAFT_1565845 [Auriscalpium vulgare]|uniref:Uncharacterized protein n=1 Tax=Auriscalpium vulgare TaxID=40419 RepID=A0ACB8RA09_9AGAM|nr:hypothetical protein FA95DRAFT_1565845 [Auriscalpium vulgare]